jgi:hypothetical protein
VRNVCNADRDRSVSNWPDPDIARAPHPQPASVAKGWQIQRHDAPTGAPQHFLT